MMTGPARLSVPENAGTHFMRLISWLFAASLVLAPAVHAAESVDLTLVLVSDVSRSIDDVEFKLEKEGYADAFTSRQVIDAIQGRHRRRDCRRLCRVRLKLRGTHRAGLGGDP